MKYDLYAPDGQLAISCWSLDESLLHLNHGSFGAVPKSIQERQLWLREEMESSPVKWFSQVNKMMLQTRRDMEKLFSLTANTTAMVPNASAGATVVFNSQPYHKGGNVLVTNHGYGAVTMGAERLARSWGGYLEVASIPLDADERQAADIIIGSISDKTRLIVLDQVTSSTAKVMPTELVCKYANRRNIPVLVDGAHVPGLYDELVSDHPWDYWVGNLHKFVCAPRGAALLITNPSAENKPRPLIDSWGAMLSYPDSFDIQGTQDITAYLCAYSAWKYLDEMWGWNSIHKHMDEVVDYGQMSISNAFESITGEDHSVKVSNPARAMRLIRLPDGLIWDHDSADSVRNRFVQETGSEAAFTEFDGVGYLRISGHAYVTKSHMDNFADRFVPLLCEWAQK